MQIYIYIDVHVHIYIHYYILIVFVVFGSAGKAHMAYMAEVSASAVNTLLFATQALAPRHAMLCFMSHSFFFEVEKF